jgi:hypothetical protein
VAAATIERDLRERLEAGFTSDFVIRFAEQADLSAAFQMDWQGRGEFVFGKLQDVAERSQAAARAILDARGVSYQPFLAGNEIYVRAGDAALATALAARAEVAVIRAPREAAVDPIIEAPRPEGGGELPAFGWGLVDSGATTFWSSFGRQGQGIVVAEMTTGVQWDHPALENAYHCGSNPSDPSCWFDPSNICGGSMCDNDGHGTAVAGVMVGSDDPGLAYQVGMAPGAEWIACKGCESTSCSEFALNSCADWLLAPAGNPSNRPHVLAVAWGGGSCDPWFEDKVYAWRAAGIFPSMIGGTAGPACSTIGSPGDYQGSFAAAAHDITRTACDFSSRGPSCFGHTPFTKPNLSAPGANICTSIPTSSWSCTYSGTSPAAAHNAGAVALMWSCASDLVGQVDNTFIALQNTAAAPAAGDCGAPPDGEGNYTFGYGYLDVLTAGWAYCQPFLFSDGFETGDTTAWSLTVP